MSGDDAVAGNPLLIHAKVAALVHSQGIQLDEAARIEQKVDAFASTELACCMLAFDSGSPSTGFGTA